ncbi:hypothetical protein [Salinigranum halophilum]|uniref:hypothetical protein n=1 Tax=Salinigranum halophilum TaxID=2565931 RepID=UPI0010A8775C|nr:hypothetical protein [Salinigranum halophilum]
MREYLGENQSIGAIALFGIPVYAYLHTSLQPAGVSFLFFPIILYLLIKISHSLERTPYVIVSAICVAFMTFYHPVAALILIMCLFVWAMGQAFYIKMFSKIKPDHHHVTHITGPIFMITTVSVISFMWYSEFTQFEGIIKRTVIILFESSDPTSPAESQISDAAELGYLDALVRFIQIYGHVLILLALSGISFVFACYKANEDRLNFPEFNMSTQFLAAILFTVFFLANYLIGFDPYRAMRYLILISSLLSVGLLSRDLPVEKFPFSKRGIFALFVIFTVIAAPLSVNTTYLDNKHLTESEYEGTEWMVKHGNENSQILSYWTTSKLKQAILGIHNVNESSDPWAVINKNVTFQDVAEAREGISELSAIPNSYVITKQIDRSFHKAANQRSRSELYSKSELTQVNNNKSTMKIYNSGEYIVWMNN